MSTGYITLSRQSGLISEMRVIANNIANHSTIGYRRESSIFSEFIQATNHAGDSVSLAAARIRNIDFSQGPLEQTNGTFDLAIEGEGFFVIQTPDGERLTRAGNFMTNENGDLVTADGHLVLDSGGAPIFIPPDAQSVGVSTDGTISDQSRLLSQIGVFSPIEGSNLTRHGATLFETSGEIEPVESPVVVQGFIESANVNPVTEISRMIEVQRSYELGQSFSEKEGKRKSSVIETLTR